MSHMAYNANVFRTLIRTQARHRLLKGRYSVTLIAYMNSQYFEDYCNVLCRLLLDRASLEGVHTSVNEMRFQEAAVHNK